MFIQVLLVKHSGLDKFFTYAVPKYLEKDIKIGIVVSVPFGISNNMTPAYIVDIIEKTDVDMNKIKYVSSINSAGQLFSKHMFILAKWMSNKYFTNISACLKCIIPFATKLVKNDIPIKELHLLRLNPDIDLQSLTIRKNTHAYNIISLLKEYNSLSVEDVKSKLSIKITPISLLLKKKIIILTKIRIFRDVTTNRYNIAEDSVILTREQKRVFDAISKCENNDKPFLLHGVTGSGKTEIYVHLIREIIQKNKQAIVLVPEISLTPQMVSYFKNNFGNRVSVTHSKLTLAERYDQFSKALYGEIDVMIGSRSAIFTPFKDLGIIIIDEEHEKSYKSETNPKYHIKEVAIKLSELTNAKLVLGSATPSLETYYEAINNNVVLLNLENKINKATTTMDIVDMRNELSNGNIGVLSHRLLKEIYINLQNQEKTILFLNRRGHSSFISCRKCGKSIMCDNCNVNYTYHIDQDKLMCHYCSVIKVPPKTCPSCTSRYIKYLGVGTQKVEEQLKRVFPKANVLRMDTDTTRSKYSYSRILDEFKSSRKASILIGTQMLSKGLDFPEVSLVGVILADLSLNLGDFRAAETTFQLLVQVAGRAGRGDVNGRVIVQTYTPDHYAILCAKEGSYKKFFDKEITLRKLMGYPPFSHIFIVMISANDEYRVKECLSSLSTIMHKNNVSKSYNILGPAPCMISKLKNKHRWKLIIIGLEEDLLKEYTFKCLKMLKDMYDMKDITINLTLNPSFIS